ncbi:MAG: 2-oxo acid dehydrogenase subunit E2 [Clostridia bacterium]|nr:2-oxo acid dehydrogenase subunit E2 [Clostridia bacterium]
MSFRADGKRVKDADPMYTVAPYIMDKRYDAMNMITVDIPVEPIHDYINKKRNEGKRISHLAVIIAAYLKIVKEYPMLNYFIVNKRIYERNEFPVAMVVLKAGDSHESTMSKAYFEMDDNIFQVNDKINSYVEENRKVENSNSTDKMIKWLLSVPGLVSVGVKFFKFLDRHGMLPKAIIDLSPFHSGLTITNLASIRTNHIYHHIYEFGTTSVFISIGNTREVPKRKNGEIVFEKCMPLGVVMDERICSGSYFAVAFRKFRSYLANPETLE